MPHGPAVDWKVEKSQGYKAKVGLYMFAAYTVIYFAFVLLCVLYPKLMSVDIGNLNVAIVFGFGIIVLAMIQAVVYNYMCSRQERLESEQTMKGKE
jgi:uncharacterized membrane protein (DUF485 family)